LAAGGGDCGEVACMIMKKTSIKILIKRIASVIFGLGITFLFLDIMYTHFHNKMEIDITFIFVCIMYVAGIVFLILWNKIKSKRVYLLFLVPILCIATEIVVGKYQKNIKEKNYHKMYEEYVEYQKTVENIPTVNEYGIALYKYIPFRQDNLLAKLDEESSFKLTDNVPILDGATAFYPMYASFVQAVYPQNKYYFNEGTVLCSRTEKAYENLLHGKVDMIFCLEPSDLQVNNHRQRRWLECWPLKGALKPCYNSPVTVFPFFMF
jgi:phosphate transport system substrate-binding protein